VTGLDREALRALVREALLDALPTLAAGPDGRPGSVAPETRTVDLRDDDDVARFVAEILRIADDPDDGPRLRGGSLRYRLAPGPVAASPALPPVPPPGIAPAPARPEQRIERGPVTERHVRAAEVAGARLVVGAAAVLTPMARDRARSAGVEIVHERKGHR
jgi:hypothetical protein